MSTRPTLYSAIAQARTSGDSVELARLERMTTPTTPDVRAEALAEALRLLAVSMRHSAGQWMVPGWDGHKVADLLQKAESALKARDAEIERLRGDAERYRWLREQEWFESDLCVLRDPKRVLTKGIGLGADCPSHDRLDTAIDQARATGGETANG